MTKEIQSPKLKCWRLMLLPSSFADLILLRHSSLVIRHYLFHVLISSFAFPISTSPCKSLFASRQGANSQAPRHSAYSSVTAPSGVVEPTGQCNSCDISSSS